MTLQELRTEAWLRANDIDKSDQDRVWPMYEMNSYINRVYFYIARETKCIRDSITASICRIASAPPTDLADLTAKAATDAWYAQDLAYYNDPNSWLYGHLVAPNSYPLSDKILEIEECKWTTRQWRLTKVSCKKWQVNPYWEQVIGMPTEYCTDLDNGRLTLNFRSDMSDTLRLQVRRLPLTKLVNETDVPEFREHYHELMLNGILYHMYSKQSVSDMDEGKATKYYQLYMADVDEVQQQDIILDDRLRPNQSMDAFR